MKLHPRQAFLYLGDGLCLAAFVLLGMRQHDTLAASNAALRFVVNFAPLLLAWTGAGLALGAFRLQPQPALSAVWGRTLAAWLIAAPLGLLLRAGLLGSSVLVVAFVLVTLALGGAVLVAWRTVFFWWSRTGRRGRAGV
jgi:hypothetical protein